MVWLVGVIETESVSDNDWEKMHQSQVCFKLSRKITLIKTGLLSPNTGRERGRGGCPKEGRDRGSGQGRRWGGGGAGRRAGKEGPGTVVTSKSCGSACSDHRSVCR